MFAELNPADRKIARAVSIFSTFLLVGLSLTGIWLFFNHEPSAAWSGYVVGSESRPLPELSSGVAAAHGSLADIAAAFVLLVAAWMSYRVLARISWSSVTALGLTMAALLTGGLIRFNATVRDGTLDVTTSGYGQIFRGEVDLVVTDRFDLGPTAAMIWTTVHVLLTPALLALIWLTHRVSRKRIAARGTPDPSWLDKLA